jgi:hypothetical protein
MCKALVVAIFLFAVAFPAYADGGSLGQWSICNSGTTDDLTGITYGNGLFVATCGLSESTNQGDVLTSPDGVTWTLQYAAANCSLSSIAYGNGIFVAVGTSNPAPVEENGALITPPPEDNHGAIVTSKDGVNWTQSLGAANIPVVLNSVTYGNGTFVAVGNDDTILTSPDGKTWTSRIATNDNIGLTGVCYGNGTFVAIGTDEVNIRLLNSPSYILTSSDSVTWTGQEIDTLDGVGSIIWGDGLFVAVGTASTVEADHPYQGVIATSSDGSTWTIQQQITDNEINGVAYGDGLFVATGVNVDRGTNASDLGEIMTSPDGVNWATQQQFLPGIPNWDINSNTESNYQTIDVPLDAAVYGNGSFMAVGDSGTIVQTETSTPAPASPTAPTTVLPVSPAQPSSGGQQPISFIVGQSSYSVGGTSFAMDEAPFISNGRTLVPVRDLADAPGVQTSWDANVQKVTITMGSTVVELVIGSTAETINGAVSQMDVAPIVVNGRTYLPARYVAEAFGYTVSWDAATQTISINR